MTGWGWTCSCGCSGEGYLSSLAARRSLKRHRNVCQKSAGLYFAEAQSANVQEAVESLLRTIPGVRS